METEVLPIEVLPINYTPELDNLNTQGDGKTYVGIEEISITYIQPADTCSCSDEDQTITITTRCGSCASMDSIGKQEGYYFDITIPEGQHWSVNSGEELAALIDDFKRRLYIK